MDSHQTKAWYHKCARFFKLAVDAEGDIETQSDTYESYKKELDAILDIHDSDFSNFIRKWKKSPFFKVSDFVPLIIGATGSSTLSSFLYWWNEDELQKLDLPKNFINQFLDQVVQIFIKEPDFYIVDYYSVEGLKDYLTPDTFLKAQKTIIKNLKYAIDRAHQEGTPEDDIEHTKGALRGLYDNSKYLPKSIIEALIKKFGPEEYGKIISNIQTYKQILEKNQLDIYNIEAIFWNTGVSNTGEGVLSRDEFLEIIHKSTPTAKDYLRRFLYSNNSRMFGEKFMLSEDMTPMSIDYQPIVLGEKICVIRLSQAPLSHRDKTMKRWREIFNEFNIIPA